MLVTPPFGASSNIALWRAYSKPPVELVVADLEVNGIFDFPEIYNAEVGVVIFNGKFQPFNAQNDIF